MARVLTFRPNFDLATKYGNAWIGQITENARRLGHDVLDLAVYDATQEKFMDAMAEFQPEFIFAMGHGNANHFSGQDVEIVLTGCTNDQVLAGTQSMFLSCLMGQELAPSINSKGGRAIAAYNEEFVWVVHPDYDNDVLNDPYAEAYKRAVVNPSVEILKGASWTQFYNLTVGYYNQGIDQWWESNDPNASEIVRALTQDRDSLLILGESAPTISPVGLSTPIGVAIPAIFGLAMAYIGMKK